MESHRKAQLGRDAMISIAFALIAIIAILWVWTHSLPIKDVGFKP